jgi:hypothetical protein
MPKVAICTANIVIPDIGAGILSKNEQVDYKPENFVQHLSVNLPEAMELSVRNGCG